MAITEIKIKIPATAANFQLDQYPALLGIGMTVEEGVDAICARKAASSAASTRAGGSTLASPTATARILASKARSSASRAAQRSQASVWIKPCSRIGGSNKRLRARASASFSKSWQFIRNTLFL